MGQGCYRLQHGKCVFTKDETECYKSNDPVYMTKRQCQNSTQLIKFMIPHPTRFGFSHAKTEIKYLIDKK